MKDNAFYVPCPARVWQNHAFGKFAGKGIGLALLAAVFSGAPVSAQQTDQPAFKSTPRQEEFVDWKFGMFLHFNMATYHERQWATGTEDPLSFAPDQFDCDQ
ncbi:MAG: hypothetical protein ACKO2G_04000 [Verrucomicrobiales bacterium]